MPKLDARTIVLLYNPDQTQVLLLRRSPEKALWPNLITGIGGKVELILGEASDIRASLLREVAEEVPQLAVEDIANLHLRLVSHYSSIDEIVVLSWYTGQLLKDLPNLTCSEGVLEWAAIGKLPLPEMIPRAAVSIPFIMSLSHDDLMVYDGIYKH